MRGDWIGAIVFTVVVLGLARMVQWLINAFIDYKPHAVYEIDTADGRLLYVGEAADPQARLHGHERYQRHLRDGHPRKWWGDAHPRVKASFTPSRVTWYRSAAVAKAVERDIIRGKNPIANRIRYKGVTGGGDVD